MSIIKTLNNVNDCDTFLLFVQALIEDRKKEEEEITRKKLLNIYDSINDKGEWQNDSIEEFLSAAYAWAKEVKLEKSPNQPIWRVFADFLYAGKIFE